MRINTPLSFNKRGFGKRLTPLEEYDKWREQNNWQTLTDCRIEKLDKIIQKIIENKGE